MIEHLESARAAATKTNNNWGADRKKKKIKSDLYDTVEGKTHISKHFRIYKLLSGPGENSAFSLQATH